MSKAMAEKAMSEAGRPKSRSSQQIIIAAESHHRPERHHRHVTKRRHGHASSPRHGRHWRPSLVAMKQEKGTADRPRSHMKKGLPKMHPHHNTNDFRAKAARMSNKQHAKPRRVLHALGQVNKKISKAKMSVEAALAKKYW